MTNRARQIAIRHIFFLLVGCRLSLIAIAFVDARIVRRTLWIVVLLSTYPAQIAEQYEC